jgi:5'-methylthioadenosine phosphorylase
MTNLQEAKLAREAEICYATMALVNDYDCWHPDHDAVTVEMVIEYLNKNSANAQRIIRDSVKRLAHAPRPCKCGSAVKHAILTAPAAIPAEARKKLAPIIGRYVGE